MSTINTGQPRQGNRARTTRLVLTVLAVLALFFVLATVLRSFSPVADFIERYPGIVSLSEDQTIGTEGYPAWARWQHFLNFFFLAMVIRTGIASRTETRPVGFWSARSSRGGKRIRLIVFTHLSLDLFWIVNGMIFVALLFLSGRWARIVPTSWEVFPSALSVALQYASLDWPTENSWVYYNSLQQLAYFVVVFILAPASIATGWRLSLFWPQRWEALVSIDKTRAIHFLLMVSFAVFLVLHVLLVFLTGALRNLNHMFAGADSEHSWVGLVLFVILLLLTAVSTWGISRPIALRTWGALTGSVTR